MPERVAVEIKNETPRAWLYRRIRPGFPRPEWISKSRASFTPDEALSRTPSGLRIKAGWLTIGRAAE
jgi:hypothetical protein